MDRDSRQEFYPAFFPSDKNVVNFLFFPADLFPESSVGKWGLCMPFVKITRLALILAF